jgi:streptomycin 6-kinase
MTGVTGLTFPRNLVRAARRQGRVGWLDTVEALVARQAERWSLDLGQPFQPGGGTAWVAPGRSIDWGEVVLKVAWRHPEAEHEAAGLREWDGDGTVRCYAVEEFADTTVLVLERCVPGTALSSKPPELQDEVVAALLRRLWRRPARRCTFRPLASMCDLWAVEFERKVATGGLAVDEGLAREGIALFRSLPVPSAADVLLCTDLHAGNVLAAEREPWLVIDPKPYVGDAAYDAMQHLLNCEGRLHEDPFGLLRRMAALLQLEVERLRLWLFARCVQESPERPSLAQVARTIAPR